MSPPYKRIKGKMIVLLQQMQKKAFYEIQLLFMIKKLPGNVLNLNKGAYFKKPVASITFNNEKLKIIPLNTGSRQDGHHFCLPLPL